MKVNNQARFSGRQSYGTPTRPGSDWVTRLRSAEPARYRSRFCTTLRQTLFCLSAICFALVPLSGCNKPQANSSKPADKPTGPEIKSSADVVKVQSSTVALSAGGSADATVILSISSGYHVNANPATFPYLIPTQVTAGAIEGITAATPIYPEAEKRKFMFANEPLAVYEGEAQIRLPLRAQKNVTPGSHLMPLNIKVQACDHEQCFPPAMLNTTMAIEVK
jgi:hypothetical protein